MNEILEIVKSVGVIIASGVAIWGINSWRREAKWKRKYEFNYIPAESDQIFSMGIKRLFDFLEGN